MMNKIKIVLLLFFFPLLLAAQSEKRVALVIGNQAYQHGGRLTYPLQDARTMKKTLEKLNFEIVFITDASQTQMKIKFLDFIRKAENADVRLIYYSGHGQQINGTNYLIPVDANITDKYSATELTINVNDWVSQLEAEENRLNLVILDACRNNPFKAYTRSTRAGLSAIAPPSGTIIAFATGSDNVAQDNGLYARVLSQELLKPQSILNVFVQTRIAIENKTDKQQSPMEWVRINKIDYSLKGLGDNTSTAKPGNVSITCYMNGTLYIGSDFSKKVSIGDVIEKELRVGKHTARLNDWEKTFFLKSEQRLSYETDYQKIHNNNTTSKPVLNADFTVPVAGMNIKMRGIQGGTFTMGSSDSEAESNETPHTVTVGDFAMMKHEVSITEYMKFAEATNSNYPKWLENGNTYNIKTGTKDYYKKFVNNYNKPIVGVSWHNAVAYAKWLSKETGQTWRLPTEAEWEYAAKGGQNYKYAGGNTIENVGYYSSNSGSNTHLRGQKSPNGYGLYDMTGNVWEWCSDWYGAYDASDKNNPQGAKTGSFRVLRGGSWHGYARHCRVANRNSGTPVYRDINIGFRLVRSY